MGTKRGWILLGVLAAATLPRVALGASVELRAVERAQEPGRWDLWLDSDVPIGDGAIGIAGATSFTLNSSLDDQFFSCAFQECGTQGPDARGSDVLADAMYVSWAGRSATMAFGGDSGPQRMGDFTAAGPVGLTFAGISSLFGSPDDAPLSNLATFERIAAGEISLVPKRRDASEARAFTVYKAKTARRGARFYRLGPVLLDDGVGAGAYDVIKPIGLALAAALDGEGGEDTGTRLLEFGIKAGKGAGPFAPRDDAPLQLACGEVAVRLRRPRSVLVPARIDGVGDARGEGPFLCYDALLASGTTVARGTQVEAFDGFQSRRYDLGKLTRICRPASLSGDPEWLAGPARGTTVSLEPLPASPSQGRLVCYQARPSRTHVAQGTCGPIDPADPGERIVPAPGRHDRRSGLSTDTVFGAVLLDTIKEGELCLRDPHVSDVLQ